MWPLGHPGLSAQVNILGDKKHLVSIALQHPRELVGSCQQHSLRDLSTYPHATNRSTDSRSETI